jgi:uncharacterized protein (DUF58 family)
MHDSPRRYLEEGENAGLRYALGLPRQVASGRAGQALSRRTGSSLEFKEHREYQPGDDLRHIDWNAYARTDQLAIKVFREELHPHFELVIDSSRSMDLEGSVKAGATRALAAFFATAAANAGFAHQAWMLGADLRPLGQGNARPSLWDTIDFTHRGYPGLGTSGRVPWRPHSLRLLLSDLLWLGEPLTFLRHFAEQASSAVVVQVLAEMDVEPVGEGNLRLVDEETGQVREVFLDEAARERYREALARHQESWQRACLQAGALFTTVVAEKLLRDWRLDDLVAAEVLMLV